MGTSPAQSLPDRDSRAAASRRPRVTQAEREAAADRLKAALAAGQQGQRSLAPPAMGMPMPGTTPDYYLVANWAFSPPLRKFVDSLPGLGPAGANNLGQYLTVAHPDTITYPGSDYYEIGLVQYREKMHSDLPPTTLRGYVQLNYGTDAQGVNSLPPAPVHYLGPTILAQQDRPVRIKFTNLLPTGSGGDLFLPVDTTVMGAGMGPNGGMEMYPQNRATLHLHGGRTPWISDGTPHQWTTPAGENTSYPQGVSVSNVPDMPDPGPGSLTFFYTNQQSARLMFYHDHALGITRLNVYAGEAAGYLITDEAEQALIASGVIPTEQIPLIIQDKSFVDADTVLTTDPTWAWGSMPGMPMTGDLWYPHVYVPAQNPYDISGVNPFGRWHYGPWFWPPTTVANMPVPNPYYDAANPDNTPGEAPEIPGVPHPSMPGESFFDTPVVNGTAFPVLDVKPQAYRFRLLNAANDRFWNLQLYEADPAVVASDGRTNTEVRMVPAAPGIGLPANWPTDGREGGVPDPTTAGPDWIQIGTEGGFLPAPAVIPSRPVQWNLDPTTFNFGNVSEHSLLLAPAERADVIVDFSPYAGKTLLLYNDAPAAFPALDARYDYYTGAPDLTDTGGHSGPQAGFGPNTRTIMQIRVSAAPVAPPYDLAALQAVFTPSDGTPGLFARAQDPIIVGQSAYDPTYGTTFPTTYPNWGYARIQDKSMSFRTVTGETLTLPLEPKALQDEMGEAFDEYGRMSGKLGLSVPFTQPGAATFVLQNYVDPASEVLTDAVTPGAAPAAGDGTQLWKITHNGVDTHPLHFHLFDVQVVNRVGWDGAIRLPEENERGWKDTVRVSPLEDTIIALRPVSPKQPFGLPDSVRPLNPGMPLGSTWSSFDQVTGQPITVTNDLTNFGWEYVWHCHILSHEEMDMMRPMVLNVARERPTAPVLTGEAGTAQVKLTWVDATPAGDPATWGNAANEIGFRVERALLGEGGTPGAYSGVGTALANATSYGDATADPALASYSYRVVAYNAAGEATSNAVTVGTATVPQAPVIGAAVAGNAQATVSFSAPASDGGRAILLYTVTSAPGNLTATGTGSPLTVTGLTNGTPYTFTVTATNAVGTGPASSPSNRVVPTAPLPAPAAPSNLTASLQNGSRVRLRWRDNATNETGFIVERASNGEAFRAVATVGASRNTGNVTYTDTTTAPGGSYAYRVVAVNGTTPSGYSNTASITVPGPPAAPRNLVAAVTRAPGARAALVTLHWTDVAAGTTGLVIQRSTNAAFTAKVTANAVQAEATSFRSLVTGKGRTFYFRVRATNAAGVSAWSNVVTITTP